MNIIEHMSKAILGIVRKFVKAKNVNMKSGNLRRKYQKLGRNAPCRCGSGKKFKYCHWRHDYLNNTL